MLKNIIADSNNLSNHFEGESPNEFPNMLDSLSRKFALSEHNTAQQISSILTETNKILRVHVGKAWQEYLPKLQSFLDYMNDSNRSQDELTILNDALLYIKATIQLNIERLEKEYPLDYKSVGKEYSKLMSIISQIKPSQLLDSTK